MTARRVRAMALVVAAAVTGAAVAGPAPATGSDVPPARLLSGDAAHGAALDPVFAQFKLERLGCKFSEQKHIALLARPLSSTGTIYFERDRGIARTTLTPKRQQVVLTRTSLRIRTDERTEDIPLDKSKDLKAFALIFPALLRGERTELERAFDLGLYGSDKAWWALALTPKTDSLRALVRRVVVFGRHGEIVSLQITEASGDITDTRLTELRKDGDVPDAEVAAAFGAR
ncbi:MAG TPA: outer membrane lipoprotein carrier protein LolA [Kofleriaceae bacterium]